MKISRKAAIAGMAVLALLVPTLVISQRQQSSQPRTNVVMDDPTAEQQLNRELWEWVKKTPYENALAHVRAAQIARADETAFVQLPTGWTIGPVGTQVKVGTLPFEAVNYAGYTVVLNTGYATGPQTISVVDTATGQVNRTLEVETLFASARVGLDEDLYVSGGFSQQVYRYNNQFAPVRTYTLPGHTTGIATVDATYLAVSYFTGPEAAGLLRPGKLALLNTETGAIEQQVSLSALEPYAVEYTDDKFYITIPGGNRVLVLDRNLKLRKSLTVGETPQTLCQDGPLLYVVNSNSDSLSVIDTATDTVVNTLPVRYKNFTRGSALTSCTVSGSNIYVTQANANAIAVLDKERGEVTGLIPTGWYPTKVLTQADNLLFLSAKGIEPRRPNPQGPDGEQYVLNLLIGNLGVLPQSTISTNLAAWTEQVLGGSPLFEPSQGATPPIRHVFYIVKENRTYDQVLGDLGKGNGDPTLTLFGREVTPAHHALADQFVTLDNFFVDGEVSTTGHSITASAYASPYLQFITSLEYSDRFAGSASVDPTAFSSTYLWDSLKAKSTSYRIYGELVYFSSLYKIIVENFGADSTLAHKFKYLSTRGEKLSKLFQPLNTLLARYGGQADTPEQARRLLANPAFSRAFSRFFTGDDALAEALAKDSDFRAEVAEFLSHYDLRYRPFDLSYSDLDRVATWKQDFERKVKLGRVEQFQYLNLPNDHTAGDDPDALTPFEYLAQNDAALDVIVRTIAASPIWSNSLILVVEDDAQDGPDHVDATRTIAFAMGPYVKRGAVVSDLYDQVSMVRTIGVALGLQPLNMTDALAVPMLGIFNQTPDQTPYTSPPPSTYLTPEDLERYQQLISP